MSPSPSRMKRLRDGKSKHGGAPVAAKRPRPAAASSSKRTRTWDESFETLQAYKEKYNDCKVPAKFTEDRALGQWVEKIRRGAISISTEQRQKLTELGFYWETLEQRIEREWNERYDRLVLYKQRFGDCLVPKKSSKTMDVAKTPWAKELGNWVAQQRNLYKQGRLNEVRTNKLEKIGFEWSLLFRLKEPDTTKLDLRWSDQYNKLVEFKEKYGHTMVTLTYQDTSLFTWVKGQREVHTRGLIRQDRKKLLDDLGFCWETNDTDAMTSHNQRQWESMFALLQEYKQTEGHVEVPHSILPLGNWLVHQKMAWRRGQLHHERVDRLHEIGVRKEKKNRGT